MTILLAIAVLLQAGLGGYILSQNPRARVNWLFAGCALAYALGALLGLLRLLPLSRTWAADLMVLSTVVTYVWGGTLIGLVILSVFYPDLLVRWSFRAFYLPLGLAILISGGILFVYASLPDRASAVVPAAGADLYQVDYAVLAAQAWAMAYTAVWIGLSLVLLIYVAVRREGTERRAAIVLAGLLVLLGVMDALHLRVVYGVLPIAGPSLAGALLFVGTSYVIIRYKLFSTHERAINLALDQLEDGILILQADQTLIDCNVRAAELLGLSRPAMLHRQWESILSSSVLPTYAWYELGSEPQSTEVRYPLAGSERVVVNKALPIHDLRHNIQGYVCIIHDQTDLRHSEEQIQARSQELQSTIGELRQTSEMQRRLIETVRTLSAPAVPVLQGILIMPLSGQIDSERAQRILRNLLSGIEDYEAKVAIIDITAVPVVDTAVAQHLIRAAQAASLMGCRPVLVGIRPEIAQVVVELGIDMSGMVTFSDLQSGVEYALGKLGMRLVHAAAGS